MSKYQPVAELPEGVRVVFSDASDGAMLSGGMNDTTPEQAANTVRFLEKHSLSTETYAKVGVLYEPDSTYTEVARVESGGSDTVLADALYTTVPGKTIILPVADCLGTVVYDPVVHCLGVLHLGRHSSVAGLIEAFTIELADREGSDPRDWWVWMSPGLKQASDALDYFDPAETDEWRDFVSRDVAGKYHIDMAGHNRSRFVRAGVRPERIIIAPEDTFTDPNYFSHRAALAAGKTSAGRMLLAARLEA